jgi:hypothetical protein
MHHLTHASPFAENSMQSQAGSLSSLHSIDVTPPQYTTGDVDLLDGCPQQAARAPLALQMLSPQLRQVVHWELSPMVLWMLLVVLPRLL